MEDIMQNTFLEKTKAGKKTIGTFFEIGQAAVGEVIALTDLDYFIIDCEHGPYDVESAGNVIRAAEGAGEGKVTPLVRVKDSQRNSILKMLDIGAKGLIIPQVQSLEEIKQIVKYGKYYPVGDRGFAFTRNVKYGCAPEAKGTVQEYFDACNEKQLLIPQCETKGCLEEIEAITAVDGIDGIFVGPYDLSVALGIPAQFDKPEFKAALERILAAVKAAGKFCIIYADNEQVASERFKLGFDSITLSMDNSIYIEAMNRCVATIQDLLGK